MSEISGKGGSLYRDSDSEIGFLGQSTSQVRLATVERAWSTPAGWAYSPIAFMFLPHIHKLVATRGRSHFLQGMRH